MFKRILILALLLCLASCPAPAQSIYGDGWFETDYVGADTQIPQDWQVTIKLPAGWSLTDSSGSVALFESGSGDMSMSVQWVDEQFWTYTDRLETEYADEYTQHGRMILSEDSDWWLGVTDDTFTAVCNASDYKSSLYFYFETTGRTADFDLARQMISSVRINGN